MRGTHAINLSSDPFRRDRPLLVAAIAAGTALTGLLAFQLALVWIERDSVAETRLAIEQTARQVRRLTAEQARLDATLRQPDNAEVFEHTAFLNALLLRKGISWTRIFADLEQVTPHNVRLVSIRPQVGPNNQVQLDMVVGSQAAEPVIEMLMKLEGSRLFGATAVSSWLPPSQSEPLYRYRVSANYEPQI